MPRAIPFLLLLFVAACGGLHGEIQGTWTIDTDATDGAAKMAAGLFERITIGEDTITFDLAAGLGSQEVRYTVKSEDGNRIVLEVESNGVKKESIFAVDGDRLTMTEKGQTLVLKRA